MKRASLQITDLFVEMFFFTFNGKFCTMYYVPPRWGRRLVMRHDSALKTIKVAAGQIEAVAKMLDGERYCLDISDQISATIALLKKAQKSILTEHLHHCVVESIETNNSKEKIDEIETLIRKLV